MGSSPSSCDRVSLPSPMQEAFHLHAELHSPPPVFLQEQQDYGERTLSEDTQIEVPSTPVENTQSHSLPQKIIDCGRIVGISIANNKGGWDSLTTFVMERERQNKALFNNNPKRKRKRELKSLRCSINYDRNRGKSAAMERVKGSAKSSSVKHANKGDKKSQGSYYGYG